ncbi:MAG: hypothetical protein IJ730_05875 [Alphaproteobacteria bacterium]|nr:hypothetical protein [Alphaproteobacteria bacterium]
MKLNFFSCTLLFNIFIFSDVMALPTDFEQRTQDIISKNIRLEKEHGDTKFAEISEQKLQDLCESLKNESKNRFDLIEKSIREIYVHCENIKPESSFLDFMAGFFELLDLAFDHIPGIEKNPNNLWDYFDFLEDISGVEREEARLTQADMKAINIRLKEKKIQKPNNSDRIFAEIELRRKGIIKDRK